ncbi:DUF3152 domain-containing protein [Streptomyces sp. NPDC096132]|uniref:DUF3152 domain-containing protein n=1 Tax=Streptomyces sp. NPDC096132 TaxID=3366075 RepID=UPI0037F1D104
MTDHKATPSPAPRRRRGPAHASARRRGKGPLWGGLAAMTVLGVAGFAAVGWTPPAKKDVRAGSGSTEQAAPAPDKTGEEAEPSPDRSTRRPGSSAKPSSGSSGSPGSSGSSSPSASSSGSSRAGITIPATGPGTFVTASGGSDTVGTGKKWRYRVEVETGLALSVPDVAEEVESILADPRGWTANGTSAFQRVSSGATDFVVKVATPGTVDKICAQGGLDTHGDYNCNVNSNVMVNLERWELATPVYAKDVPSYRALIINHEVGHFLGHNHVGCPGAGKPAPAMMQQIKGMNGCVPNVWPYDADGNVITGPAVP